MKMLREEISGNGGTRLVFATSVKELNLIMGLLKRYSANIPIGENWKPESRLVGTLITGLKRGLNEHRPSK